ncbi:MAG: glycogen/starch synthase, partial [Candidatus Omnitrophica bacterium]|nr:glycogen/starch synthase [Candidatus Omnitrophota bacterium]
MHRNVLTDALGSEDMAVIFQDWSRKAEELQQEINYAIEFNNRLKAGILRLPIGLTERGAPIEVSDTSKSGVSLAIKQKFADVGSSQDTCYGGTSVDITNDGMIVRYYELNHDDMPPSRMNQREFTFPEPQDITDVAWDQTYSLRLVVTVNKNIPQTLLRGTKHFLKIIVLPPNDELEPYPATMPTTDEPDRIPNDEELQVINTAFGSREALAAKRITLDTKNVVISPALEAPAEVKSGILYINPNTLRGPPEQLKIIFEGHELCHLSGYDEQESRNLTIQYLIQHKLLSSHIEFLASNKIGLVVESNWLSCLKNLDKNLQGVSQRKITMVSPEVGLLAKAGGLADVLDGLSRALINLGHDVSIITILYDSIDREKFGIKDTGASVPVYIGKELTEARIYKTDINGIKVLLVYHPLYAKSMYLGVRQEHYDMAREAGFGVSTDRGWTLHELSFRQAVFFKEAALGAIVALGLNPDIIHLHDWQTGLIAASLKEELRYKNNPILNMAGIIFTIHNLGYQGRFDKHLLELTGLGWNVFTMDKLEFYDNINLLKAGIVYADIVNTVSQTYAQEIQTEPMGEGLSAALRMKGQDLLGILNGLDYGEFNPKTDRRIFFKYNSEGVLEKKLKNKIALRKLLRQEGFAIKEPEDLYAPLIGVVARLVSQ